MSTQQTFIIVGASLAGAKAAEELRTAGFDGRILLLGAEPERPYERPPLTKDYLRDESPREKAYVHEEGFYPTTRSSSRPGSRSVRLMSMHLGSGWSGDASSASIACCSPSARSHGGSGCRAPSSRASTTYGRWLTVTCFGSAWRPAVGWR